MLRSFILFIGCFLLYSSATTQEQKKLKFKDRITVDGFVKYMNTNSFVKLDTIIGDNLIHNLVLYFMFKIILFYMFLVLIV